MRIQDIALIALAMASQCLSYDLKAALEKEAYCLPSTHEIEAQALSTWSSKCIDLINQRISDRTSVCETSYPILLHFQLVLFKDFNACELVVEGEERPETLIKSSILSLVDEDFSTFEGGAHMVREYWKLKDEDGFINALRWIMRHYPTVMKWGPQLRDLLFYHLVKDEVFDNLPIIAEYLYASGRFSEVISTQELQDRLATLEPTLVASILLKVGDDSDPGYTRELAIVVRQAVIASELSEFLSDGGGIDLETFLGRFGGLLDEQKDPRWEPLRHFFKHQLASQGPEHTTEMFFSGVGTFEGDEDSRCRMEEILCQRPSITQDLVMAFLKEHPELSKVRTWSDSFCAHQKSLGECLAKMIHTASAEPTASEAVHQVWTSLDTY